MTHRWWTGLGLGVAFLLVLGLALSLGTADVSFVDAYRVLLAQTGGNVHPSETTVRIVWNLRLPRALLAFIVGGGLAVVGVAMQTLVRNPLAEPYILGISSGATAGASLFYLGFLPPLLSKTLSMPVAAFGGGLMAIVVVYLIARTDTHISVARLLLAGVAMSALMAAITSFVTLSSPDPGKLRAVLFWLLGSLSGARWGLLPLPTLAVVFGTGVLLLLARPLDALLMGEESARSLGMPVEALKRGLIVLAAFVTGSLVAVSGAVGFVGLIVPHIVRRFTGVTHRRLVPASFVIGALFLAMADLAARTLLPVQELPVGILTALCGGPFFLALLRTGAYRFGSP